MVAADPGRRAAGAQTNPRLARSASAQTARGRWPFGCCTGCLGIRTPRCNGWVDFHSRFACRTVARSAPAADPDLRCCRLTARPRILPASWRLHGHHHCQWHFQRHRPQQRQATRRRRILVFAWSLAACCTLGVEQLPAEPPACWKSPAP